MDFRTTAEWQRQRDLYYMFLAEAARSQANCLGSEVGAILVRGDRVISTGYNGTPAGFLNCRDPHPEVMSGKALDICFCVHAEQNTLLNAARHGIAVKEAVLYVTHQPCFSCLKESVQAGISRIAFLLDWHATKDSTLLGQYTQLTEQLQPVQGAPGFGAIDSEAYRAYREAHVMILDEDAATGTAPEQGTGA
jgi:dCMP deaminase